MRILSLDGGGYLGLATAAFIAEAERHFQTTCYEQFDLFCGTSTGAIITLALASGKTGREVVDLYRAFGATVFKNPFPGARFLRLLRGAATSYSTILILSTPPNSRVPGSPNPSCKINGMEYLCDPRCIATKSCCGPNVDLWFTTDMRAHWDWVEVNRPGVAEWLFGGVPRWALGFAAYAARIPHKSYPFPTMGDCGKGTCQGTVTSQRVSVDDTITGTTPG